MCLRLISADVPPRGDESAGAHSHTHAAAAAGPGEHVPEAQSLVPCACDDALSIRRHGQVQHPEPVVTRGISAALWSHKEHSPQRVTRQRGNLLHTGILPHNDLVEGVAVCGHYLVHGLRPHEITNLPTENFNDKKSRGGIVRVHPQGPPLYRVDNPQTTTATPRHANIPRHR